MTFRYAAALPLLAGIVGTFARPARAAEDACAEAVVEADAKVRRVAPNLTDRVRAALVRRDDIDACARVHLRLRPPSIEVEVLLADGRSAARSVARAEDVVPTVEALLLLPRLMEHEADEPVPEPSPATVVDPIPIEAAAPPRNRDVKEALPPPPSHVRIELSAGTGVRINAARAGVSLGVQSFIDANRWLVGFGGRFDYFQEVEGGPPGATLSLAVLGGRRVRLDTLSLDFVAGPGAALQGSNVTVEEDARTGRRRMTETRAASPRLLFGTRLSFRARSTLRTFVALDGDIGPREGTTSTSSDPPRMPAWMVGLAVGATVGTL